MRRSRQTLVTASETYESVPTVPILHASEHTTGGDPIPTFDAANRGLVPASGGGTTNFLRADGTFSAPPGGSNLALTQLAPSANSTVTAGYGCVVPRKMTIPSGVRVTVGSGGRLRIL